MFHLRDSPRQSSRSLALPKCVVLRTLSLLLLLPSLHLKETRRPRARCRSLTSHQGEPTPPHSQQGGRVTVEKTAADKGEKESDWREESEEEPR